MLLGIIGFVLMTFAAMSSVPSVGAKLSWKEWRFVQLWLGQSALLLGMIHIIIMGAAGWNKIGDSKVHEGMPSITFISTLPIMLVVAFRAILLIVPRSMKPKSKELQLSSWNAV